VRGFAVFQLQQADTAARATWTHRKANVPPPPSGPEPPHYRGFPITLRHTALGRTILDDWSVRRRDPSTSQHTTLTTDTHPRPRWDSNPQSQHANGRSPMP